MSRIRMLPDLLVNKIAAGEVVERPASVVKELVENALDAGATRVAVTIEDGGKQLIRVTDDGEGMTAEDLGLAVMPHATSKLSSEDDLYRIATLGFRGEALASIGAVSNMRIVSRKRGSVEGHQIIVSGEKVQPSGAAGGPEGTTVEVRDLFFNVPARRKFLRTHATETGHIHEQFARLALGFPEVGFDLTSNGRLAHQLPADQRIRDRIASLYGPELADELIPITRDERGIVIEAYAAPPIRSRSTTSWQSVFVNGRYIRDRFVQHAVREAYRGLMEHDRQPVYLLFVTVDPETVDVNVHPTKIEVRWRDSNLIHSQVLSAFRETFFRTDLTPALRTGPGRGLPSARFPAPEDPDAVRRQMVDALRSAKPIVGESAPAAFRNPTPPQSPSDSTLSTRRSTPSTHDAAELWRSAYAGPAPMDRAGGFSPPGPAAIDVVRPRRALQLHNTYLVVESDEGMLIIDQHALHERILYNQLCERLTSGPLEGQRLLLPETLTVTPKQMTLLQENEALLHQIGIEVTSFGHDAVAVQSFPALLKDADAAPFLRDLLDKLEEKEEQGRTTHPETLVHELLDMMACKAAVKAGDPLTPDEIDALVAQKDLVEKSSSCPHGRPTTLRLTVKDLEKQFKRT
ncbi:MAG: DNA mismatch repair endonuclease MutL [Planctomycetota bacterium]